MLTSFPNGLETHVRFEGEPFSFEACVWQGLTPDCFQNRTETDTLAGDRPI
ncbi:MAG: hypothetical protein H6R26_3343 [Proteobacteria bacterium]|nr:hypothetical protein [Pseudomonadota bacterium]